MSKKSLISSLVVGAVLTLSLGLYTLVTAIMSVVTPSHTKVAVAYTSEQTINAFSNFSVDAGNLTLKLKDGQKDCLVLNKEDNTYTLNTEKAFGEGSKVGDTFKFDAVATTDKHGSTKTFNVTVYKQGTGESEDNPYLVANGDGLEVFAEKSVSAENDLSNAYVELVEDVDLAGKNWKGIGSVNKPFAGEFVSNGKDVKNMSTTIDASNYTSYVSTPVEVSTGDYRSNLAVGLFNVTKGARIAGVGMDNAKITIDPAVYDLVKENLVVGEQQTTLNAIQVGLLIGSASETEIDGQYITEVKEVETTNQETGETEITQVPSFANNGVSGTINGFTYTPNNSATGMGGLVGVIDEANSTRGTTISNCTVVATINNNKNEKANNIGGVAGTILGTTVNKVAIYEVNAELIAETLYNTANNIGGVAGIAWDADIRNVNTTINVKDTKTSQSEIDNWLEGGSEDTQFTYVAGLVAQLNESTVAYAQANVNIDVKAYGAGAFVTVTSKNTVENVTTTGNINAIYAAGFAHTVVGTTINYSNPSTNGATEGENTETQKVVAVDVKLTGYYVAGFVNRLDSANLVAADGNVVVKSVINTLGYEVSDIELNNTVYSAGLVGYFFASELNKNYFVSGFDVETTINNGVDMAGLVAYVGLNSYAGENRFVIQNCSAIANLNSYTSAVYDSSAHKVAGAVATIYGATKLENVSADVHFNANHKASNKYGVAMFGGLVSRIGGENVELSNCTVTGDAYANTTIYTKYFIPAGGSTAVAYKQLVAGGLVGLIAKFGKDITIPAGGHPIYEGNKTYDALVEINVNTMKIENCNTSVNITIEYTDSEIMGPDGYRVRGLGKLIGIVLNSVVDGEGYSTIDLSTNTATGTITADDKTFSFKTLEDADTTISTKSGVLGTSRCKVNTGNFAEGFKLSEVKTELPEETPDTGDNAGSDTDLVA